MPSRPLIYSQPMSGQIICIGLQTGRHTNRKSVHTSRRSSVGSQQSNMFDSCDPIDDRFENSEFDCLHMTIGLQTGRCTLFAYRFAYRSSCVNALLLLLVDCVCNFITTSVNSGVTRTLRREGHAACMFTKSDRNHRNEKFLQ